MIRLASLFWIVATVAFAGRASHSPSPDGHVGGCNTKHELPPLQLTAEHKRLLSSVSPEPRTALDYYMRLPKSYFSIMPDSRERRVTYIDIKTLSGDYLHAFRAFECDGGGFQVTLKLYRTPAQTFVAIDQFEEEVIFDDGKPTEGEPSISIVRPSLWRYFDGSWHRLPNEPIPKISPKRVLTKYHRDWDADRREIGQEKFIWIDYVLSPTTKDIVLMGRENFQPDVYEYTRLKWRNTHFSFK